MSPTSSLQSYSIRPVDYRTAKKFFQTWHYSRKIPTARNVCFGLFDPQGQLYAVIDYGDGTNMVLSESLGYPHRTVWEIMRLARIEPAQNYPLSKLISITSRLVVKQYDLHAIVAYADPMAKNPQGREHHGGIYKAAGFEFLGMTNAEWHCIDEAGKVHHRRVAYRRSRTLGITIVEARKQLGLKRFQTKPKYRWLRMFRLPIDVSRIQSYREKSKLI